MTLEKAEQALAVARQQQDEQALAEALVIHANVLVESGQLAPAQADLDEAVLLHRQLGQPIDEARCLIFAATLARLQRDFTGATCRAEGALALAAVETPLAVSATAELGEIAFAQQQFEQAAHYYGKALAHSQIAGLLPSMQAELLRQQARAWVGCDRTPAALQALTQAHLLVQQTHPNLAIRILIEQATALQQAQQFSEAEPVIQTVEAQVQALQDPMTLADVYLLKTTQALHDRQIATARELAHLARECALQAVAPVQYISSVLALSELANAQSDWLEAYAALATGWVTLADLMGQDVARETFRPQLLYLKKTWGNEKFAQVKALYETSRA
jgi:tetratricopeptide (TPR) repeat protein